MKANEAPKKIYVHVRYKPCEITFSEVKEEGVSNNEYTRTDAFIEKVEEYIYSALNDGIISTANIEDFMRLFKIYMEG